MCNRACNALSSTLFNFALFILALFSSAPRRSVGLRSGLSFHLNLILRCTQVCRLSELSSTLPSSGQLRLTQRNSAQLVATRFELVHLFSTHQRHPSNSSQLNATRFKPTQRSSTQFGSTQPKSTRCNSAQLNSTPLGSTQRNASQLNSTRRNLAQPNSTQLKPVQIGIKQTNSTGLNWTLWQIKVFARMA